MKEFDNFFERNSITPSDKNIFDKFSNFKENKDNKDDCSTQFQDFSNAFKEFKIPEYQHYPNSSSENLFSYHEIQTFSELENEEKNSELLINSHENTQNESFWRLDYPINDTFESGGTSMEIKLNSNPSIEFGKLSEGIINQIENKNEQADNSRNNKFIGKKKKLFKVIYPIDFNIFHRGEFGKYPRNLINSILNKNRKYIKFVISDNEKNLQKIPSNKNETRKNNSDNIRKKIKARFIKKLKNTINDRLKIAKSKKYFQLLPQKFISNVSRKENRGVLELTFKDIFSKKFYDEENKDKADIKKYNDNISVLHYLDHHKDISEKSNYVVFKNMKYYQIYEEYINSREFEIEIINLKRDKENSKYIENYIKLAYDLNDFFYQ